MTTKRVYLHIGPLKTGTTFIQGVFEANVDRLAEVGVLFPRGTYTRQIKAVLDVLGKKIHPDAKINRGEWQSLVEEVQAWQGDKIIISQEFMCTATPKHVRRIVRSLQPAEVHVIATARELSRVIPAAWQTHLRNRRHPTWPEYLHSLAHPADTAPGLGRLFWRQQDPAQVFPPWETEVPRERIHVVTVPPPGADPQLLWQRFGDVVGLDAERYTTEVRRRNTSLGVAEAELLRRINAGVVDRLDGKHYNQLVKMFLARQVLERQPEPIGLALPPEDYHWVSERSEQVVDYLASNGYHVTGDLSDLVTGAAPSTPPVRPDDVDPAVMLEAAIEAVIELLVETQRRTPEDDVGHSARPAGRRARRARRR